MHPPLEQALVRGSEGHLYRACRFSAWLVARISAIADDAPADEMNLFIPIQTAAAADLFLFSVYRGGT